ncbi:DUF2760 domain-containing protein [Planctomicrobium piriforme]|uniref:DUF2760 domain-containing protein n=1 Tax=Planctomicrobium piriforme TaxID=1576369 RepID=A0A1I3TC28_9PLAN|nr:DUF2760 domain-containing protein [Planctomicrobium piriforme]SFJ67057.1 protein of unknown function [Planctomicrobium piriforme]
MGRLGLAFRIFFEVLFNQNRAEQVRALEAEPAAEPVPAPVAAPTPVTKPVSARSDALTLLETLQREARLLDFIQEEISAYSDQQVGSAVRDVHRGCRAVFQRLFSLAPAIDTPEGSRLTLQGNESAAKIRLVGKVVDQRPLSGVVVHPGWRAEKCDVPTWQGTPETKDILAPAEVELA